MLRPNSKSYHCTADILLTVRDQRSEHRFDRFLGYLTLYCFPFPVSRFFQLPKELWKTEVTGPPEAPPVLLGITNHVAEPDWVLCMILIHFSAKSDTSAQVPWVRAASCWTLLMTCRRVHTVCTQAFFTKVTRIWQQPPSEACLSIQPLLH